MERLFFGREKELALLRKNFFITKPGPGYCAAVNGPNDVGKTMLIRQAAKEFEEKEHPNVYYFHTGIIAESSYWHFWNGLIRSFAFKIPEEKLWAAPNPDPDFIQFITDAYAFFKNPHNIDRIGSNSFHSEAIEHLNLLFLAYTTLGIHILIAIDEFDNAQAAFPVDGGDGSFFQRLYMLSPKSSNEYTLSILLISRRRISTIAHHMADGSDIESAFPPAIILRGFNSKEMEEYFESYQALPCSMPSEEQKRQIYYFCGRHPGQLMKMRDLFERYYDESHSLVPAELYHDYGQEMTTLYERMNKLLRTEYVDQSNKRNCVDIFSQVFVGPAYDTNLMNYLEQLYKYGLLTKWDKQGKNVFQLAGQPYDDASEQHFDYEPMSPYYVEYFRLKVEPEELEGLSRLMSVAEHDVRDGILKVLKAHFPESWESILEGYTSNSKEVYRVNLDLIAYQNDADMRNITYTNLDVFSYSDYSKIIRHYWEQMRPYFRSFATKDDLETAFNSLKVGRNCFAHNNARILDPQSCSHLRELCTMLIQDYEKSEQNILLKMPLAQPAGVVAPTLEQIQQLLQGSKIVTFCYQEKKKPKGNLRGVLKGYGFPAGISKVMLSGFGENFSPEIGAEFPAAVDRWDANAGLFNLVAPKNGSHEAG